MAQDAAYDAARSGAEWWVQFRSKAADDGEAIGFHWDKDERSPPPPNPKSFILGGMHHVAFYFWMGGGG